MPRISVSPTEGLVLECALGVAAVSSTIACIQGATDALPLCIGGWVLTLVNIPHVIRFFTDKPARKYYTKFKNAMEILKKNNVSEEKRKKAFETIVEAAQGGYPPAKVVLAKLHSSQSTQDS